MHSGSGGRANAFELWRSTSARNGHSGPPTTNPDLIEITLPRWLVVALSGIALGLAIAKYSQAWAQDVFHPAAIWGSCAILIGMALPVVVVIRGLGSHLEPPPLSWETRALMGLSVALVLKIGWAALMIIWLAGWQFPPSRL